MKIWERTAEMLHKGRKKAMMLFVDGQSEVISARPEAAGARPEAAGARPAPAGTFFGALALGVIAMGLFAFLLPGAVMTAWAEEHHVHCMCGKTASCGGAHNASQEWQPFDPTADDRAQLPVAPGYYYLTEDVELKSDYSMADGVFLCLNGHTVNTGDHQINCEDGTLTITNCSESGGIERKNYDHSALVRCYMINARSLNLYNTRITLENLSYGATMLGFRETSGEKSKYHIEGCTITYENDYDTSWGGGEMYALYLDYTQSLTIKDTKITGSSYSDAYGILAYKLQDPLLISNTQVDISTITSSAAAMTVSSVDGTAEQVIEGCGRHGHTQWLYRPFGRDEDSGL